MGDAHERGITIDELKQELLQRVEPSDKSFVIPLISAATIDGMLKDHNVGCQAVDTSTTPYRMLVASSMRYMSFIKFSEGDGQHSLGKLYRLFLEQYVKGSGNDETQEEVATVGAGFIFGAFHREEGPEFIDRIRGIPTSQARGIITSSLDGHRFTERQTIYDRGMSNLTMPSDQPHLSHGVDAVKNVINDAFHMALEDGAISALNVLNQMRSLFKPQEQMNLSELLGPAQPRLLL